MKRFRRLRREEIQRVLVVSSAYKPEGQDVARAIVTWLQRAKLEVVEDIEGKGDLSALGLEADLAISVGGDGTMLSTARRLGKTQVPTLGVNLGKLGFLAEFSETEVREWIAGRRDLPLQVTPRMRLRCTVRSDGGEVTQYALNDAVVNQGIRTRLITIKMSVDDEHAIQYRADGLIVSTPVGSTAYSLSLGGPILAPGMNAFMVTPIAPHALTNRPIVVAGESTLRFEITSPVDEAAVVLDGHEVLPIQDQSELQIRRAEKEFLLVSLAKRSYFYLLRSKLGWGDNPRYRKEEGAGEE
ncbi:MAG: NAD(+)/NADH kinase [Planctomycetota bacterium]